MSEQPLVWIIDNEQWPRAALRAELIERGCDAVGFVTLDQALARLKRLPRPRAIVLELRGQVLVPADLEDLAASGVPVVLLGGAVELDDPPVRAHTWAATLNRPVTLGEIASAVERILKGAW